MDHGERYRGGLEAPGVQVTVPPAGDLKQGAGQGGPGVRPAARRWRAAAAWAGAALALYAFFARISFGGRIDSDGSNNALQAWDLVHGHILLHGWHIGDASFYFFELPLNGITELIVGLGDLAAHLASALTYLIVAACAAALAVAASTGAARAVRCAVVVTVLAVPLLAAPNVLVLLEEPDHVGTSVFILVSFLLVNRAPSRWYSAPLLCLILCAGQVSDLTVRYVAVPAIVVVCGYQMLAARKLRSMDAAFAAAAAVSVPLESVLQALMVHVGGFTMVAPRAKLSSPRLWPQHAWATWLDVRILFGAVTEPDARLGALRAAFGVVCILAALAGLGRVLWTWRTASRAEQLVGLAIVFNLGVYVISVMPLPDNPHEIAAVLPCGAILAARALVPARIASRRRAVPAIAATALIALVPLAVAAARPPVGASSGSATGPATAPLSSWLTTHGLTNGIGGYWDASVVTVQSGDKVKVRAVDIHQNVNGPGWKINIPGWESNALWYDPSRYQATFAVADVHGPYQAKYFQEFFGQPEKTYRVANWIVLVYKKNLLAQVLPMLP
jgi:hypothetical protein